MKFIDQLNRAIAGMGEEFYAKLPSLLIALAILLLFVLIGRVFHQVFGKRIERRWKDRLIAGFVANALRWSIYGIGLLAAMDVLGVGDLFGGLLAGAGVGAIIFGFAFKDIGENFLAGILMAFNQPFDTGDIIEVDGHKGVVRDLDMRTVHIRNAEGKDIYLPNSLILKSTLINYTKDGSIRLSFDIGIAPEENIEQIRTIVLSYIDSSDLILKNPKPNVLVNGLGEFTVDLTVLFWVDILVDPAAADETLGHTIRSLVIKDVKELLENANVSMPSQVLEHKMYRSENFRMENP